jgi:hypothetical protein
MPTDRTANLGLTYTGDAAANANLDKLDAAIGAVSAPPADSGPSQADFDALVARVDALDARVTALEGA